MLSTTPWTNACFQLFLGAILLCVSGCATSTHNAIPARRLPAHLLAEARSDLVPLNYALLGQPQPKEHRVGAGDVLGVHVPGALPDREQSLPTVILPNADEHLQSPSVGHPATVRPDGTVGLPLIGTISLEGKTLREAKTAVQEAYSSKQLLGDSREHVFVDLIRPRTYDVMVVREDASGSAQMFRQGNTSIVTRHGSAQPVELAAYENDLLHAISESGGLPGDDGFSAIWILRQPEGGQQAWVSLIGGIKDVIDDPEQADCFCAEHPGVIRIPTRVCPGEPVPFKPEDVILKSGDVVYIESRAAEVFYAGGLLPGAEIPLPRDRNLDIISAVAVAGGAIHGPAGINSGGTQFRSGVGNIVPPTRVIILRTVAQGQQIKIHVNLKRAMRDPKERILIQPQDVVMLQYTPSELASNVALNIVNLGLNATRQVR